MIQITRGPLIRCENMWYAGDDADTDTAEREKYV